MVAHVYVRVSWDSVHHKVISLQQEGGAMSYSFRQKFKHFMQHDDEDYCDKRGFWTIMWQNAALMTKNPLPFSSWPFLDLTDKKWPTGDTVWLPCAPTSIIFLLLGMTGGRKVKGIHFSTAVEEMQFTPVSRNFSTLFVSYLHHFLFRKVHLTYKLHNPSYKSIRIGIPLVKKKCSLAIHSTSSNT